MKKSTLILVISLVVTIIFSLIQVILSNSFSTAGSEMAKMENQLLLYKTENVLLKQRLLYASSLTRISSEAAQLGFIQKRAQVFLTDSAAFAIKR